MLPNLPRSYWTRLLSVALLIRIVDAFVVLGSMPFISDARSYSLVAMELLRDFPGSREFFWPPGQPLFLTGLYALFGTSVTAPRIGTIVLNVLCVVITVLLARRVLNDERSVRLTGWVAALYPPSILMSGQPYSQPLASVALLLAVYWIWRAWKENRIGLFLLGGIALGIGTLTRSSMLSMLPVLGVIWLILLSRAWRRNEPRRAIVAGPVMGLLVVIAIILPFMHFNAQRGAGWSLSTNNEANFFDGNCPYTHFYKTSHLSVRDLKLVDSATRAYIHYFVNLPNARQAMMDEALRYMAEHPFTTANRTLSRIRTFWGFDYVTSREIQNFYGFGNLPLAALLLYESGGYVITGILVIIGLFLARDRIIPPGIRFLLWMVIAYQIPYMISYSAGNYHFPTMWLLMPFAGAGLARITPWRREIWETIRRNRKLWIALGIFVLIQIEYAYWTIMMSA